MASVVHRICPFCEACCGLELTIEDDKIAAIRGHAADVHSQGFLCPKATALRDLHDDPDRLRTPLIKRDGVHVEATWDEAFAEIERRLVPILETHGRDAVGTVFGNPAAHKIGLLLYTARLARAIGSRNVFSASTLDQMPKQLASGLMFGHWLSVAVPDLARTDLLVVIGANPLVSNGSMWTVPDFRGKAKAMQARGGKLIVIDPRRTETAAIADQHLFIRPAGDVFLLLGLVHQLFADGLVNLGRIAPHVDPAALAALEAAVADFAPARVVERCGIAAETIRALAHEIARTPRAALYARIGTCTTEYGTLASWLVDVINTITGHLDEPGGVMFPKAAAFAANTVGPAGRGKGVALGRRRSRVSGAPEVFGELPIGCLTEEITTPGEGQIRALITVATNPVLSMPSGPALSAALDQLELLVSVDIYLNETTRHADVILPGLSPLQDMHYDVAFPQMAWRNTARVSLPVWPPRDRPMEWEVLMKLVAIASGKGAAADVRALDAELTADDVRRTAGPAADAVIQATAHLAGPERLLDLSLRAGPYGDRFGLAPDGLSLAKLKAAPPGGVDLGPLTGRIPEMLRTPSGKVELAPPLCLDDLGRVRADLAREAPPLVIIGRRQLRSNNSWMHNLPVLAKGPFRCTALVSQADASRLGLADGGRARIANGARAIEVEVEVSDEMMPGVVSLPHGWGHDLPGSKLGVAGARPGANLNALLDDHLRDPLSGNAVLGGVAITMQPL
ncbi:MAG TPA: molybdopterin-dependent oxidoreductase [Kofleriaceae bacterium]|nr:molybdopterin-dependent oxidoreductase [Kofleriaceae bacterium]